MTVSEGGSRSLLWGTCSNTCLADRCLTTCLGTCMVARCSDDLAAAHYRKEHADQKKIQHKKQNIIVFWKFCLYFLNPSASLLGTRFGTCHSRCSCMFSSTCLAGMCLGPCYCSSTCLSTCPRIGFCNVYAISHQIHIWGKMFHVTCCTTQCNVRF